MNDQELDKIESALNIKLPDYYREWVKRMPRLEDYDEYVDIYDWAIWEFVDPDAIIRENLLNRENGIWTQNHFCLGSPNGEQIFIDLNDPEVNVYGAWLQHEPYYDPEKLDDCLIPNGDKDFFSDWYLDPR